MKMALFCLFCKRYAKATTVAIGIIRPFQPEYADDGFDAGRAPDVARYFREAVRFLAQFGLKYDLSQYTIYLLSADNFRGIYRDSRSLGFRLGRTTTCRC